MKISEFCLICLKQLDPSEVVHKKMSYSLTAQDLIEGLESRDEEALRWVTSVARFSIDVLLYKECDKADFSTLMPFAQKIELSIFDTLFNELSDNQQKLVFSNKSSKFSKKQMSLHMANRTDVAMEYVCAYLDCVKKVILNEK